MGENTSPIVVSKLRTPWIAEQQTSDTANTVSSPNTNQAQSCFGDVSGTGAFNNVLQPLAS